MNLIFLVLLWATQLQGWDVLEDVKFESEFDEDLDTYVDIPTFGAKLQALSGKRVKLKGYYLPAELEDPRGIIMSRYPYAACFFCGGAGLESVVEVHFAGPPKHFKVDDIITVEGTLVLNKDDFDHLVYILNDAKRMVWEDREQ